MNKTENEPYILGFSDSVHDRSVCIYKGNKPLVAIEEERLSRIKHGLPLYKESRKNPSLFAQMNLEGSGSEENESRLMPSILYCLSALGITLDDISIFIGNSLHIAFPFHNRAIYINHHLAHAASSFFASGFPQSAILVVDGYGDVTNKNRYETVMLAKGNDKTLDVIGTVKGQVNNYYDMENSLGVFYRIGTLLSGFGLFDEGKTMGLAAYGKPEHLDWIETFIQFKEDLVCIDNKSIWESCSVKLGYQQTFAGRANIASTFQYLLEKIMMYYADILYRVTGSENLCIAGGVGLNCVANARLLKESKFKNIFVFPAPGDNGISFGAASYAAHSLLGLPRTEQLSHSYFGKTYATGDIRKILDQYANQLNFKYDVAETPMKAASLLKDHEIIFWFQEGSEMGPRALGHRSILANPIRAETRDYINSSVKFREAFRPLAPMVLEELASEFFDCDVHSPFMLLSPQIKPITKKVAPAIVHCDDSARLQTISNQTNPVIHELISEFYKMTGVPVILNTSMNGKDEPIVETPEEAINAFVRSPANYLFIDGYIVTRKYVPTSRNAIRE